MDGTADFRLSIAVFLFQDRTQTIASGGKFVYLVVEFVKSVGLLMLVLEVHPRRCDVVPAKFEEVCDLILHNRDDTVFRFASLEA